MVAKGGGTRFADHRNLKRIQRTGIDAARFAEREKAGNGGGAGEDKPIAGLSRLQVCEQVGVSA